MCETNNRPKFAILFDFSLEYANCTSRMHLPGNNAGEHSKSTSARPSDRSRVLASGLFMHTTNDSEWAYWL